MKKLMLAGALALMVAGTASAQDVAPPKRDSMARQMDTAAAQAYQHKDQAQKAALDINTASKGELEAVGLGAYADKIIAQRPFKSAKELVDKQIVPQAAWGGLKDKVKVGPS